MDSLRVITTELLPVYEKKRVLQLKKIEKAKHAQQCAQRKWNMLAEPKKRTRLTDDDKKITRTAVMQQAPRGRPTMEKARFHDG